MGIYIIIYIIIYMSVTLLRMRKIIIIITCTCNGSPWFSWYTAKVWHAAAFSCNLREASALMRIHVSSNYYYSLISLEMFYFLIKNKIELHFYINVKIIFLDSIK